MRALIDRKTIFDILSQPIVDIRVYALGNGDQVTVTHVLGQRMVNVEWRLTPYTAGRAVPALYRCTTDGFLRDDGFLYEKAVFLSLRTEKALNNWPRTPKPRMWRSACFVRDKRGRPYRKIFYWGTGWGEETCADREAEATK